MGNVTVQVLQPTMASAFSNPFTLGNNVSMTVTCAGLQNSETGTVQVQDPESLDWYNYYQNSNSVQFNNEVVSLDLWASAATYRINKSATAALVGISVTTYSGSC